MVRQRTRPARGALALLVALVSLAALEFGLRIVTDAPEEVPAELDGQGADSQPARFVLVVPFGFRPVLGGPDYGPDGALYNSYPREKGPDTERILFIGDSVTARGRIVRALQQRADAATREWWNGGVESFDLEQAVRYFEHHTLALDPDHVVLTFHVNDYQSTPVEFTDPFGQRVYYSEPPWRATRWTYGYDHILVWRYTMDALFERADERSRAKANERALAHLADLCRERGIELDVLVLPALQPEADTSPTLRRWHQLALAACRSANVRHHDLLEPLQAALSRGIDIQESPGDWAHPSQAAADAIAEHLLAADLFG
ncbi:MAG: hypothetical protein GC161_09360 [Planctomycetaceae bacterium]|nr:hypothetical protein [Planctomycetaceae bacterium]